MHDVQNGGCVRFSRVCQFVHACLHACNVTDACSAEHYLLTRALARVCVCAQFQYAGSGRKQLSMRHCDHTGRMLVSYRKRMASCVGYLDCRAGFCSWRLWILQLLTRLLKEAFVAAACSAEQVAAHVVALTAGASHRAIAASGTCLASPNNCASCSQVWPYLTTRCLSGAQASECCWSAASASEPTACRPQQMHSTLIRLSIVRFLA